MFSLRSIVATVAVATSLGVVAQVLNEPPLRPSSHATSPLTTRLPRVASINLCSDQLVLSVASPDQIVSLSWLASDPEESLLAARAREYAQNYGTAEELLRHRPDVVIAGRFTGTATVALLDRLEYRVVTIEPATTVDEIARNLRIVARAIGQSARAEQLVATMQARLESTQASPRRDAVVVRPGGFTVGSGTLADALLAHAGLDNVAARQGLDRWGSLSVETLLRSDPDLIVVTAYRTEEASLANAYFSHPALRALAARVPVVTVPARYWACGLPASLDSLDLLSAAAGEPG